MILSKHTIRIAIIGGRKASDEALQFAYDVGKLLGEQDILVYTGGGPGIMESCSRGVHDGGGIAVGVLKGSTSEEANQYVQIPIMTGMGDLRNGILVRSVHGAIAIEGNYGTLSEIAYTLGYEKPAVGFQTWDIPGLKAVDSPEQAVETILNLIGTQINV